jgi:hypothetical protein
VANEPKKRSAFITALALMFLGVVLIVSVLVLVLHKNSGSDDGATAAPSTPAAPSTSPPSEAGPGVDAIDLPAPTGQTNGYPTGYPNTPEGAVAYSAASQVAAGSTLEYDEVERILRTYIKPPFAYRQVANEGTMGQRQRLGIAVSGAADPNAFRQVDVQGVKWRVLSPGRVEVAVDTEITYTKPDGSTLLQQFASTGRVVWSGGRWWADATYDAPNKPAYAAPGSRGFVRAGWKLIRSDEWRGDLP